jgi:glutamine synthetase
MTTMDISSRSERHTALTSLAADSKKTVRKPSHSKEPAPAISEYFGELTFGLGQMRERLPHSAYQDLLKALEQGKKLTRESADAIAQVIKEWAVSKGATHFCHWFQPMTGLTAEKHDAFISIQHSHHSELKVVERFTGSMLIQGEPDASSFPSGGMRSTFEARGYTAWDPSSPLFLIESEHSKTLCIPTVFFGFHGQALDLKTPMLRSVQALSSTVCAFLKTLGDVDVKRVISTLGSEQEYFLIDKRFAALRPDLLLTGRTLLGASSPRHQQLEDHYFGSIPERVKAFMEDAETELYKLGIPVKTRHNEVAPSQFELAPIFEDASIAADHNTLLMETMKRVALRHGLVCLTHEKPFAGINGNGKHCNWSMSNDKGENLLDPGSTPHQNLRFLAVTAVVMKAVHDHSDALRASIASPGNDHRLGGNEAPPAIISVFLGSLLAKICEDIEAGKASGATESQILELGVSHIPNISRDYTDRNRTSPFAFTGNKFEFRAVGGSANVAVPVATLNAAVASTMMDANERLKELLGKKGRDEAVMDLIREYLKASRPVRFEGNNYSAEWQAEAKKRGLPVLNSTAEALQVWAQPKSVEFLQRTKVLSKDEVHSRYHVAVERYNKTLLIEHHTLAELVNTHVIPAIETQLRHSSATLAAMTTASAKSAMQKRIGALETTFAELTSALDTLKGTLDKVAKLTDEVEAMKFIASDVTPGARKVRDAADSAETQVADGLWPLPKYREMLFAFALS